MRGPASELATQSRFSVRPKAAAPRGFFVRSRGDQRADFLLVGLESEIGLDQPGLSAAGPGIVGLEGRRGGLGRLETLEDEVRHAARPALVGHERQAMGGVVRRQAFEHGVR